MLRTSLRSVRALGSRQVAVASAARQWQPVVAGPAGVAARVRLREIFYILFLISSVSLACFLACPGTGAELTCHDTHTHQRAYADDKKPSAADSKIPKIPAYETTTAAASDPPTLKTQPEVNAKDVPLSPPAPGAVGASKAAAPASPPPPPPPPAAPKKKKGFFRRLLSNLVTLALLGALSFGSGVWYSRINDNFHDFFTEYIPFGEQAVLYLEELDFQKRYPRMSWGASRSSSSRDSENVRIQPQSGASWRVADSGEPAGRQKSAVRQVAASKDAAASGSSRDQPATTAAKPKPEASQKETAPVAKSSAPVPESTTETAGAKVRMPYRVFSLP